ncbi:hypothetical protein MNBD_GAMMA09-3919 [hydrothermal vent metagenome]|uniref:Methyltransferase type 11 domain-containing protein n=1 Tax=hydrothermal vent metagenome TaxID=652676 RepID=A0A3B0XR63_9ZZZZ
MHGNTGMKKIETQVADHYGDSELLSRILDGLEASGLDRHNLQAANLAPVEEFHTGGKVATEYAVAKMSLKANQHVLDVGCGIGGTVRHIAEHKACQVTGIDLTPEYISAAKELSELTGFDHRVKFQVASALDLPFQDMNFDAAISLHVAMNIHDRVSLYTEIARVLKSGATFCLFDMMKKNSEALKYPVPWSQSIETSHLTTADEMLVLLDNAGFYVDEVEDRTEFALEFFKQNTSTAGPPPLGLHLVMGESAAEKLQNTLWNLENGRIAPVQMLARRK